MHLLLLLLVSSLAVPPVISKANNWLFKKEHTYNGNTIVDCTNNMNPILKSLNMGCKDCNTFILGANRYTTDTNDVDQVCNTGGINPGGVYWGKSSEGDDLYRSTNNFRVVSCRRISGAQPPDCVYGAVTDVDIISTKITVACDNKNKPKHLDGCY